MRKNKFDNALFYFNKNRVLRYVVAIVMIVAAASLRVWPLAALELRIPWVTFYPAVMATALYGGFSSGMLATVLSAIVVYFWSPTHLPFIDDPGDWLGMAVFCINGTLISLMSGAMHRAKEQAEAANQAKSVFFPADLIEKLQRDTVILDKEQCLQTAEMISDHNPELGNQLRWMVEELQYKKILMILDNLTEAKFR